MIYVRENDRRPFAATILKRGSVVVDLTGAVGVTFRMRENLQPRTLPKVEAAATVVDAINGNVQYEWAANDTDHAGLFYAEWTVDWGSSIDETFPTLGVDPVLVDGRVAV
jgi:hypothetical protein